MNCHLQLAIWITILRPKFARILATSCNYLFTNCLPLPCVPAGASLAITDFQGRTPVEVASAHGHRSRRRPNGHGSEWGVTLRGLTGCATELRWCQRFLAGHVVSCQANGLIVDILACNRDHRGKYSWPVFQSFLLVRMIFFFQSQLRNNTKQNPYWLSMNVPKSPTIPVNLKVGQHLLCWWFFVCFICCSSPGVLGYDHNIFHFGQFTSVDIIVFGRKEKICSRVFLKE